MRAGSGPRRFGEHRREPWRSASDYRRRSPARAASASWSGRAGPTPARSAASASSTASSISNYEPLIALAAAAGATERIRLMPSVLLGPLRGAAVLAKQAATLDALSGGRLTLGLGVGGREDDYPAAAVPFDERGRIFDEQTDADEARLGRRAGRRRGRPDRPAAGARRAGRRCSIGGGSPAAIRRVGRWGDGFIGVAMAPIRSPPPTRPPRRAGGRPVGAAGRASCSACTTCSARRRRSAAETTCATTTPSSAPSPTRSADSIPSTPEAVKGAIAAYAGIGVDEIVCWPCAPDLEQVDRLAELVG